MKNDGALRAWLQEYAELITSGERPPLDLGIELLDKELEKFDVAKQLATAALPHYMDGATMLWMSLGLVISLSGSRADVKEENLIRRTVPQLPNALQKILILAAADMVFSSKPSHYMSDRDKQLIATVFLAPDHSDLAYMQPVGSVN